MSAAVAANVRLGVAAADPVPVLVGVGERGLKEILGQVVVARQQVCRAGQCGRAAADEVAEVLTVPLASVAGAVLPAQLRTTLRDHEPPVLEETNVVQPPEG